MENASPLLFNFSKESNIWRGSKHLFVASDTDSPGKQNVDALSSAIISITLLSSWEILVRRAGSL